MRIPVALVLAFLAGCSKNDVAPEPSSSQTTATTAASSAPVAAQSAPEPSASAGVFAQPTTSAAPGIATTAANANPTAPLAPGEGSTAKGETWSVDVPAPNACERNADCGIIVHVRAQNGFHVNKDYPTKLEMTAPPSIEMLGTDAKGKNFFTKAAGNFNIDGETVGTMNAKFKGNEHGVQKLSGKIKFSVCSAANCQMESADITASVPIR